MFVGHAALAFAVVAVVALRLGWGRQRVLVAAGVAGLFATVPDVDMLYATVTFPAVLTVRPSLPAAFWGQSTVVHRVVTHSLVVAVPAAAGFALVPRGRTARATGAALLAGTVVAGLVVTGPLAAAMLAAFAVAGAAVGLLAARAGLGTATTAGLALVGLASHPFGDVFTGEPPAFFYPVDATLLAVRVGPFADPTLDLLLAFGVELAAVWAGVLAAALVLDVRPGAYVAPRAALGAGYALVAPVLPAPTLDVSYHFVFSVLAVGVVGVAPGRLLRRVDLPHPAVAAVTGLTAVTMAGVAYTVAYLLG